VGYGIDFVVSVTTGSETGTAKVVDGIVGVVVVVIGVTGTDTRGVVRITGVTVSMIFTGSVVFTADCGAIHPAERMYRIISAPVKSHSIFPFMIFS